MSNNPKVSIIIPAYNSQKFLKECILSALAQTITDKEIIIINDGSTDDTLKIAKSFENNDVIVIDQKNKGASSARNVGVAIARGKYIQFLDADDILHPDKILRQVELLESNENYISVCPTVHFFEDEQHDKLEVSHDWLATASSDPIAFIIYLYGGSKDNMNGAMIQPNAWLCPAEIIHKAGKWHEELSLDDDGEFFCRVILAAKGIIYSPASVNYYRKFRSEKSLSGLKSKKGVQSEIKSIELKQQHLTGKVPADMLERMFSRFYWWTGFSCYPHFKDLSKYCIQKAKQLNYAGEKYIGGERGKKLTRLFGWKLAKRVLSIRKKINANLKYI